MCVCAYNCTLEKDSRETLLSRILVARMESPTLRQRLKIPYFETFREPPIGSMARPATDEAVRIK